MGSDGRTWNNNLDLQLNGQFHRAIRDGLVEKIWDGTTTILSLDVVRATREPLTLAAFLAVCIRAYSDSYVT
jgi:hypothetical protein